MPDSPAAHWDYTLREWSSEEFQKLLEPITKLKVVYDIGANVGGFSRIILDKFPDADVYAWEPVDTNYAALKEYMPGITAFQEGIFYGATESRVCNHGDGNIGALFVEQIPAGDPIFVDTRIMKLRTLEEYKIPKPDLVKMDVEGSEDNIIENSTLLKKSKYILVEWHHTGGAEEFFKKHLPKHQIIGDLQHMQYLLCLKSR